MGLTGIPFSPLSLQEQRELLQSLRQTAFESESEASASNFSTERRRSLCAKEFRKLGFMVRAPRIPSPAPCWLCHPDSAAPSDGSPKPGVPVDPDGPPGGTSLLVPWHR